MSKNNNERNTREKKPFTKKTIARKMYKKSCSTAEELFDILCNTEDPVILDIINPEYDHMSEEAKADLYKEENALATMAKNVMDYVICTETPNILMKENVHTSLLVKPNKLAVQTNKYIGFGWNIENERPQDHNDPVKIKNIEAFITLTGTRTINDKEAKLLEEGWVEETK